MRPIICLGSGYVPELDLQSICSLASEVGFDGVELWVELPDLWEKFCQDFKTAVKYAKDVLASFDLTVTVHGATNDLNLSSYNPRVRALSIEELATNLKFCHQIGSEILTIHGSTTFKEKPTKWDIEYFIEGVKKLLPICDDHDIQLSIETPKIEDKHAVATPEVIASCSGLHEKVQVTYDTSHVIGPQHDYSEALKIAEKLRERIREMHLGWNNSKGRNTHAPVQSCKEPEFFKLLKNLASICQNLKFVVLEINDLSEENKMKTLKIDFKITERIFGFK